MMRTVIRTAGTIAPFVLVGCAGLRTLENPFGFSEASNTVYRIVYSPDGKQLATGHCWAGPHDERSCQLLARTGHINLWSVGSDPQSIRVTSNEFQHAAVPTFVGDQSLVVHDTSKLIFCDAAGTELERREVPRAFALDTAHQLVACLTDDDQPHRLLVRDFDGDVVSSELADPEGRSLYPHTRCAFSPDAHFLAACTRFDSRSVQIWNWSTGELVRQFDTDDSERIYCPSAFKSSSDAIAFLHSVGEVRLHNIQTGDLLQTFTQEHGRPLDLCFSPDDRLLAVCGESHRSATDKFGFLIVWDVQSGQQLANIKRPDVWGITALQFSPDGQTLAAGLSTGNLVTYSRHELLK